MADGPPPWKLVGFLERLDAWIARDMPTEFQRVVATAWILGVIEDPYRGMRREPGFPNLWFGPVPGSMDEDGKVVVCAYWVEEATRTVRCDSFAILSFPL